MISCAFTGCQQESIASDEGRWVLEDEFDASALVHDAAKDVMTGDLPRPCAPLSGSCIVQQASSWPQGCDQRHAAIFDGERCRSVQGCGCTGGSCPAYPDVDACARACAAHGTCNEEVFPWPRSFRECIDLTCQEGVALCIQSALDPTEEVQHLFPDRLLYGCSPPGPNSICGHTVDCDQAWCCHVMPDDGLEQREDLQTLCAMSLRPQTLGITCVDLD